MGLEKAVVQAVGQGQFAVIPVYTSPQGWASPVLPLLCGCWWAGRRGGSIDGWHWRVLRAVPGHPPQLLTHRCRAGGGAADLHPTGWGENPGSAAQALIKSQANNKRPE